MLLRSINYKTALFKKIRHLVLVNINFLIRACGFFLLGIK